MKKYIGVIIILLGLLFVSVLLKPKDTSIRSTPTPTVAPSIPSIEVNLSYVLLEDNGVNGELIGCGDSLVALPHTISSTNPLQTTLEYLLSSEGKIPQDDGLYSALSNSELVLDSITQNENEVVVKLRGEIMLGGVCDNPRLKAQLEKTIQQFTNGKKIMIFINEVNLNDLLSEK